MKLLITFSLKKNPVSVYISYERNVSLFIILIMEYSNK